jgi:hypothetical protein
MTPEIGNLRCFGGCAKKFKPKEKAANRKFGPRSQPSIIVGCVHDTTKIWRLWWTESRPGFSVSDLHFHEDTIDRTFAGPQELIKPLIDVKIEERDDVPEQQPEET